MQYCCIYEYLCDMKIKYLVILLINICFFLEIKCQIIGRVVDENKQPLIGVTIFNKDHEFGSASDEDGLFDIPFEHEHSIELIFSYIGFETRQILVQYSVSKVDLGDIILIQDINVLDVINVTDVFEIKGKSLSSHSLSEEYFQENNLGTFAKSLEKIPGISAINVGVGIAKPVIRGLSSNRIIVQQYGIKQESQQWGSDHGLEIDAFDVEKVEIIKGPTTLQYGSDGLGGVINIKHGNIPIKNSFSGSVQSNYKTNNNHLGVTAKIAMNKNNFFSSARYTQQRFSDYTVPAEMFEYNTFTLPIFNNRLKNTAGKEQNIAVTTGYTSNKSITRLTFNHYKLNAGIFSGAVGIPRSYSLQHDGNYRNIETPKQEVDHYRFTLNQSLTFKKNLLSFNLGFQNNIRSEYTFPEFHNIPTSQIDFNNQLGLNLVLRTYSVNVNFEQNLNASKINYGMDFQRQFNKRSGFEYLIPDYDISRNGIFTTFETTVSKFILNGGLRLDIGSNSSKFHKQFVWNSNEEIIDSLISEATNNQFFNWSTSLGASYELNKKNTFKINFARSFRIPHPSETSSNGIHHGTFRHEQGTSDLISEIGYQSDIGLFHASDKITFEIVTYFNFFKNFIYLGPTFPARFSTLPESGQLFKYRQDDAIFTGFETELNYKISKHLAIRQTSDFVQSINLNTGIALPFSPQPTIKNSIQWNIGQTKFIKKPVIYFEQQYYFPAKGRLRIDRSERETPSTFQFNVNSKFELSLNKKIIKLNLQIQNIFNQPFLNHLSRYRLLNIPEQGRNLILMIKYNF